MRVLALLFVGACGRIGFDIPGDGGSHGNDSGAGDDGGGGGTGNWVGTFVADVGAGATGTYPGLSATAVGDAIVLQTLCATGAVPASVTVTFSNWSWHPIGIITGGGGAYTAAFGAIATDTNPHTLTTQWSTGCAASTVLADEFTDVDPTGGSQTFGANGNSHGTGDCMGSIVTVHANETVWAACASSSSITSVGPGLTKGADNGDGDWAAYKATTDPAFTIESLTFGNAGNDFWLNLATINPK